LSGNDCVIKLVNDALLMLHTADDCRVKQENPHLRWHRPFW